MSEGGAGTSLTAFGSVPSDSYVISRCSPSQIDLGLRDRGCGEISGDGGRGGVGNKTCIFIGTSFPSAVSAPGAAVHVRVEGSAKSKSGVDLI